ncbi:hypothetical protein TNCV_2227681 [Trichonephila clavipes]|nr:hypothetical protein TNCV_2227681 [Trichonephila clavipes]
MVQNYEEEEEKEREEEKKERRKKKKKKWSVAKSPRVAEQCDVNIQSINQSRQVRVRFPHKDLFYEIIKLFIS